MANVDAAELVVSSPYGRCSQEIVHFDYFLVCDAVCADYVIRVENLLGQSVIEHVHSIMRMCPYNVFVVWRNQRSCRVSVLLIESIWSLPYSFCLADEVLIASTIAIITIFEG